MTTVSLGAQAGHSLAFSCTPVASKRSLFAMLLPVLSNRLTDMAEVELRIRWLFLQDGADTHARGGRHATEFKIWFLQDHILHDLCDVFNATVYEAVHHWP